MAVKKEKKFKWNETKVGKWLLRWGFWAVVMPIFLPWIGQLFDWNGSTLGKIFCWIFAFIALGFGHKYIQTYFDKEQEEENSKAEKEARTPKEFKDDGFCVGLYVAFHLGVFLFALILTLCISSASFHMRYTEVEYTLDKIVVNGELVELDEPVEFTVIMKRSEMRESLTKVCPEVPECPSAEDTPIPETEKAPAKENKPDCVDCPGQGIQDIE